MELPTQAKTRPEWATRQSAAGRRHCFAIHSASRLLSRRWRPLWRFNAELPGVLGHEPLPAGELHRIHADDVSHRIPAEKAIQDIEADMPARGAPCDEAAIDAVPQRQARAGAKGFEFP